MSNPYILPLDALIRASKSADDLLALVKSMTKWPLLTLWNGMELLTLPGWETGLLLVPWPRVALLLLGSMSPPYQLLHPSEQRKLAVQWVAFTEDVL